MRFSLVAAFAAGAVAIPVDERALLGPSVTISRGTVVGTSLLGVDTFNGIPYAQPPIGQLRLKPPRPVTKNFGTLNAVGIPKSCPQFFTQLNTTLLPEAVIALLLNNPITQAATDAGEDCLTLNVQRPAGVDSTSKLPVVAWIYGGGFEFGSTQTYNAQGIITKSIQLGKPVVYVAMNYRLAGFGFLAGKELMQDDSTNLGLRDQRLALKWIQDNIAAFGGDPDRVTIWGESAGAISVCDHTLVNGGNNTYKGKPLFKGAIMNSGSLTPARTVNSPKAQAVYDAVVKAAKCDTAASSLECLRSLSYEDFNTATNIVPSIFSYDSINLAYVPRPDPSSPFFSTTPELAVARNKFAKVPIIIGDQRDEGTLFSLVQSNITNTAQLKSYLGSYFPGTNPAVISALVDAYPDEPAAGSPFGTGELYNVYPEFKRLAAILGDITFTLTRRGYLGNVSTTVPSWSYINSYLQGTPVLGTFHGSDITTLYDGIGGTLVQAQTLTYYISFFYYGNPNMISANGTQLTWPKWTDKGRKILDFGATSVTVAQDRFRTPQYEQLLKSEGILRI